MNKIVLESSSDEDDTYTNSVSRFRALKRKRLEQEKLEKEKLEAKKLELEKLNELAKTVVANGKSDVDDEIIYVNEFVPQNARNDRIIETEFRTIITRSKSANINKDSNRNTCINNRNNKLNGRRPFINELQRDLEIVSSENCPNLNSGPTKDDIIALSSDDDNDSCNEDDNYEIDIKVMWRSIRLDRLSMRKHDSFLKIFQHYSNLENVSINEILIMNKDKVVSSVDTPASLGLSVIDILDGGIVSPGMNTLALKDKEEDEKNSCSIKVQTANKKQSLTVPLKKNQQFRTLFSYCALHFHEKESSLKFEFDGEQISPTDTPESLDMEGEACIDLQISS